MKEAKVKLPLPAVWGGLECTINRVNDKYLDQLEMGGFYKRPEDLDSIIATGIKALRFPVLWEKHQPHEDTMPDFSWAESHLVKLRAAEINPIVGLLHHGSGPLFTNLLDEDFPAKFASYAAKVARKFPWITDYTPINEPLTTARFSGLYGFWFPHKSNDVSFIKMLLIQLKAIVLAMREIRKINPSARLIQTEDLGKTYSTALLSYQATFENHRRWLTYDILTGLFDRQHALWGYFMRLGIKEAALHFFLLNPCAPDVIGINYYLTSERYLDENTSDFPSHTHGGNGLHRYADIEAVRANVWQPHGAEVLFREIGMRYKLPLVISEVHLHCTREEQLRWFKHIFLTASSLRAEGFDVQAVTVWSMLGSFGWNKLLTSVSCDYETGVFDISAGYARPTALARVLDPISEFSFPASVLCGQPGWWLRLPRPACNEDANNSQKSGIRPLLILGKNGRLGAELIRQCKNREINYLAPDRGIIDICNSELIEQIIKEEQPWAIINAAGYVDVETAEIDSDICYKLNTLGAQKLAILCEQYKVKLLSFSSDLVFNGNKSTPYNEDDTPCPLNVYGKSKLYAETFLAKVNPSSLMVRTSAFFSPAGKGDFVSHILKHVSEGREVYASDDQVVSPTYVPHLAEASLNLLIDDACGIWHLANQGARSWYQFACDATHYAGYNVGLVKKQHSGNSGAQRPKYSVLSSKKYGLMPTLNEGLKQYFSHELVSI